MAHNECLEKALMLAEERQRNTGGHKIFQWTKYMRKRKSKREAIRLQNTFTPESLNFITHVSQINITAVIQS